MRVLVACEFSNVVRDAFLRRGHDAYSCDLDRADHPNRNFRRHIRGDVRPPLPQQWDLVIAHPPCTHLANSGAVAHCPTGRWYNPRKRALMEQGVSFFLNCYNANADKVCVENPIMLGAAMRMIGIERTQIVQPYHFGEPRTKSTCLWLRGLPILVPTDVVKVTQEMYTSRGKKKIAKWYSTSQKNRSRTFLGIAAAMAEQWG